MMPMVAKGDRGGWGGPRGGGFHHNWNRPCGGPGE